MFPGLLLGAVLAVGQTYAPGAFDPHLLEPPPPYPSSLYAVPRPAESPAAADSQASASPVAEFLPTSFIPAQPEGESLPPAATMLPDPASLPPFAVATYGDPTYSSQAPGVSAWSAAAPPAQVTPPAKEPARRALPAPFPAPPFPSAEYQGYPLIGVPPDTTEWPLMKDRKSVV